MNKLAINVLETFYNDGLYTADIQKDGSVNIEKTKITKEQYDNGLNKLKQLNSNGYTKTEQQQLDEKKQKEENNQKLQIQMIV